MPDLRKLMADMDKTLAVAKKDSRDDLPTVLELLLSTLRVANFDDSSILDDAEDLAEKVRGAL